MYIPWFLQVVFPYFIKNKNKKIENQKEGKSSKRKIRGLRKNIDPKRKEIKHESVQVQMPLLFTLLLMIMEECQ